MPEARRRRSVSAELLHQLIERQFAEFGGAQTLDVVDVGGGTGAWAIELAARGHHVTVVDPSPDALASLERRVAEAGPELRIGARQGDASDLPALVGAGVADVVVCHRVLEVVDSVPQALSAMATVLRSGGLLSLLVPQRAATVLAQALAGHIDHARRSYADDHLDHETVLDLVVAVGFEVRELHGIGAIADHVPGALVDDARAYADLLALEHDVSTDAAFRAIAPQLHVLAIRG